MYVFDILHYIKVFKHSQSTCLTGFPIALFFCFPFAMGHNFGIGIRKRNFLGFSYHSFFAENATFHCTT